MRKTIGIMQIGLAVAMIGWMLLSGIVFPPLRSSRWTLFLLPILIIIPSIPVIVSNLIFGICNLFKINCMKNKSKVFYVLKIAYTLFVLLFTFIPLVGWYRSLFVERLIHILILSAIIVFVCVIFALEIRCVKSSQISNVSNKIINLPLADKIIKNSNKKGDKEK